jgi:hypothetical protein
MRIDISRDYSPVHPREHYRFMFMEIDISKAWRIIAALSDRERGDRAGKVKPPKGLLAVHWVDTDRAMESDLSIPLLVGQFINARDGEVCSQVIDGYHRVYKAVQLRKRILPAFKLTVEETAACRLDKGGN